MTYTKAGRRALPYPQKRASVDTGVTVPSSDYLTELLRLVERDRQRITDLEHAVAQLRQELADEIQRRRVLSSRVDRGESER